MATLTGQKVKNSYKDLLQVSNSNSGVDGTLRTISDGEATDSVLQLSSAAVNVTGAGTLQYGGTAITSTGANQVVTLAAGLAGQLKIIYHKVDGGSIRVTPAATAGSWSYVTLTAVGDTCVLMYLGGLSGWAVLAVSGPTPAAIT